MPGSKASVSSRPYSAQDNKGLIKLLNFFSPEWIIRPISPDYGLDYDIEPWKDGQPLNKLIKLQVKNNELTANNSLQILQLKVSTLNYLNTFDNTFILSLTRDDIHVFSPKAFNNTYNINQSSHTCSIPLVYQRNFRSEQYYLWNIAIKDRVIFSLLGAELALDFLTSRYRKRNSFENYYLTNIKNENERHFFEREELANFGFYYSTLKKGKKTAIQSLLKKIENASHLQIRGILEGLSYLSFSNEKTENIALQYIESNNTQDILVAIMHLATPNNNKHLETILKGLFGFFDYRSCIIDDGETRGIELTCIEALFKIGTMESLDIVLQLFCKGIVKPTEIHFIYKLLKNCSEDLKQKCWEIINKINNTTLPFSQYYSTVEYFEDLHSQTQK